MNLPLDPTFATYGVHEYLGVLHPLWPRRTIDALFARGRVQSGGRPVGAHRLLRELDDLVVVGDVDESAEIWAPGGECGVEVLAEDASLIAIAKPSGVPVVPDRDARRESCLGFLIRRELAARSQKPLAAWVRPRVVHRIDRLTSGVVLFARTPDAERELTGCFEDRRVAKTYLALLLGDVLAARVTVDVPIASGRKGRMRANADGKAALTVFEPLERFGDFTLAVARPRTGRTHQIRVHALAIGHPLAVDPLYRTAEFAGRAEPPGIERLTLHALSYELPATWPGQRLWRCEPSADFAAALEALRGRGRVAAGTAAAISSPTLPGEP